MTNPINTLNSNLRLFRCTLCKVISSDYVCRVVNYDCGALMILTTGNMVPYMFGLFRGCGTYLSPDSNPGPFRWNLPDVSLSQATYSDTCFDRTQQISTSMYANLLLM